MHKKQVIEAVAIAGSIAAGLACVAVTAGAGAVVCMVGTAALINLAKDAAQGDIHSVGDAVGSLGSGALTGAMGVAGGAAGAAVAKGVARAAGSAGASLASRALAGAAGGGVSDAVEQFGTTGEVDMSSVAVAAGIGAVTGARLKVCRHSFAAGTMVVMADGSRRRIERVRVGDRVVAVDPVSGRSAVRRVTALHTNRDRDLTDVTVRVTRPVKAPVAGPGGPGDPGVSGSGQAGSQRVEPGRPMIARALVVAAALLAPVATAAVLLVAPAAPAQAAAVGPVASASEVSSVAVLETTAHHPFWETTTGSWVNAADLSPGDRLRVLDTTPAVASIGGAGDMGAGGVTVTVTRIDNHDDTRTMHDLTVRPHLPCPCGHHAGPRAQL